MISKTVKNLVQQNQEVAQEILKQTLQGLSGLGRLSREEDVNVLSFDEILQTYNQGLSDDEISAWVYYKHTNNLSPMRGWEKFFFWNNPTTKAKKLKQLVDKGFLFYCNGDLLPYPIYCYANIYDRILQLEKDKDHILETYGAKVFEQHQNTIDSVKPKALSFLNPDANERPKLLVISAFCNDAYEFTIQSFKDEYNVFFDEPTTLQGAFRYYLQYLNQHEKSALTRVSLWEIWELYVNGRNMPRGMSDSDKERVITYGPQDGEYLFARMLNEALKFEDVQKLDMLWNRKYNGWSSMPYHRVPIGFECSSRFKNGAFKFTPIQREAIAFSEVAGSCHIAYDVGVGKTIAAIISLANAIHQGRCKRPLIVVPNGTYKKWIGEIFGFTDTDGNFVPGVLSNTGIKLNDWFNLGTDVLKRLSKAHEIEYSTETGYTFKPVPANSITMLTYQGLEKLGFGQKLMEGLFNELTEILVQDDDTKSNRDIAKQKEKFEEIVGIGNKNSIVDIDALLIDYIVIDEAHNFKNVFSYVPADGDGKKRFQIESAQSARAIKAFFITNYIQRTYNSNVMGLTATPFTNNPIEIYSMLSLVGHQSVVRFGVKNLYTFMEMFINQSYEYVNNYDGGIVRKPTVKAFNNRLLLQRLIYNHISYKTGEEAGVKRPCKINLPRINHLNTETGQVTRLPKSEQKVTFIQMNEQQRENQDFINGYVHGGSTPAEKMARIMRGLALSLDNALSPYIFAKKTPESAEDFVENSPKIKYVIECVKSVKDYHETKLKQKVSGQVIYANRGKEYFKYIKEYLQDYVGYQTKVKFDNSHVDEVEIITSGISQDDREYIKEAFLAGVCKVIIGTATIREGIDLQKQGTVLYNLYPDWNPTDLKQLEGRIWRQGNMFGYVRIVMPLVQDSMDVFVFQKLEEKTARVNDIWFKADRGNVLGVESIDPEEVKFALYTNLVELSKIVIEKEELEIKREDESLREQIKMIKELSYSMKQLDKFRFNAFSSLTQARINLDNFEALTKNYKWEDYSETEMAAYKERAAEYSKSVSAWETGIPQSDKEAISLYNTLSRTIFGLKSLVSFNNWEWDQYKQYYATVAKAEQTIFTQKGYDRNTNFVEIEEELNAKLNEVLERRKYVNSTEHRDEIIYDINIKKQLNKVEGRVPEMAAEDFVSLNYLLKYQFIDTDIENCAIPYPDAIPPIPSGNSLKLKLKLKLKAKALKLKLQLAS